jgi:glycerol-3-phosphate dehydrogenase (NAD(P)+)
MPGCDAVTGHVAVLGDGSMGTTLAETVARGDRRATLWCRSEAVARSIRDDRRNPHHFRDLQLSPALDATHRLDEAVDGASLVIVAVGSPRFRETARTLGAQRATPPAMLSATKGIDLSTLQRMSEVLAEETASRAVGTISGPNVTPDIMARQLTAIVIASPDPAVIAAGARALETPRLKVYGNEDLAGVEIAGVLKNVIAVAMGIATGIGSGSNARSFLFTRGLAEIRRLGMALGASPDTFYGLAGIGDLFLTSTSPDSLNYRVGIELGSGKSLPEILAGMPEVPEGISSTRGCCALARRAGVGMPIAEQTRRILDGEANPASLEDALASHDDGGVDRHAVC